MSTEAALVPAAQPPAETEPQGMVMPAHVAAVVPFTDHDTWSRLTFEQQARVSVLLSFFKDMVTAPEGVVAASNRIARTHSGRGFSGVNLRTLYYKFRDAEKAKKGSGWLCLAKIYTGRPKLPPLFVQEVKRRMESNSVSMRAAITALKADWADGVAIPGYGTWRDYWKFLNPLEDMPERYPFGFIPPGWSESNLYTKQSTKAQRTLKILGRAAAQRYLPHVMRDLSGLRFMELIVIDDFETDQLVLAWNPDTRKWQLCRCAGLLAIDAATRTKLAIGLKPRFTTDEGKKMSLTRADVQGLLYEVFRAHGMPTAYGCTILCENAAAAISGDFELALQHLLGVQVARTGLIHEKTLRNGFVQSGGRPWEKPWIESMFRLMHSTAGAQPGQKGSTYQLKPADLEAKILYTEKLLNTEGLSHELAVQMQVPFLKVEEFLAGYDRIFARMEDRTDHRLQGFEERMMFRLPDGATLVESASLSLMAPEERMKCLPVPVMESPRERRARLSAACTRAKVADHVLACLLLTPKRVELRNHRLTFSHQAKGYTFADADSPVMQLEERTELLGYFDPARPSVLHVTDMKGRYVGVVKGRNRVDIRDEAAIGAEQAEVSRLVQACVINPVRERHAAEDTQLLADKQHNQALLEQAGLAQPEKLSPAAPSNPARESTGANAPTKPSGDKADLGPNQERQATLKPGLSRQLRNAPARDAFATYQDALAQGIAREVSAADEAQARAAEVRAQGEALNAEDLQAFRGDVAKPLPAPTAEPEETMKDYS